MIFSSSLQCRGRRKSMHDSCQAPASENPGKRIFPNGETYHRIPNPIRFPSSVHLTLLYSTLLPEPHTFHQHAQTTHSLHCTPSRVPSTSHHIQSQLNYATRRRRARADADANRRRTKYRIPFALPISAPPCLCPSLSLSRSLSMSLFRYNHGSLSPFCLRRRGLGRQEFCLRGRWDGCGINGIGG